MATSYQHQNLVVVPEDDPLEAISRQGAQRMLTVALKREVEEYLERQRYVRQVDESEFRGYRNGYGRERQVTIGSGAIKVRAPRVSDIPTAQELFESKILKPYQKRSQKLAELFPKLFVEGLATRDFEPALRCLPCARVNCFAELREAAIAFPPCSIHTMPKPQIAIIVYEVFQGKLVRRA